MTRRALVIGSQTYGLAGCESDAALVRDLLTRRGFDDVDFRIGGDATRAGILDGFERLIGASAAGDTVVVYYSGHGGRITRPDFEARQAAGLSTQFQFLVPHDMDQSAPGDFRGILSEEVTAVQRRLADAFSGAIPNVTTILDCCHSGYLARAVELRPKSIGEQAKAFSIKGIREHAAALSAAAQAARAATNPDVVRVVACQAEQSAYELPSRRGGDHGALTDALVTVLDELGESAFSWSTIGDLVRRRVRSLVPEQRPDVEGPADRIAFSTESLPDRASFTLAEQHGRFRIEAAAILGIAPGDEFDLCQPGGAAPAGTAVVGAIEGGDAMLDLTLPDGRSALGLIAVPRRVSVPRVAVRVDVEPPKRDPVAAAIAASRHLTVANDAASAGATASVVTEGDGLRILDSASVPWRVETYGADPAGLARLVEVLDGIAVGDRLLDLPSGTGASALDPVMAIRFGAVVPDGPRELALHGERLPVGTMITLSVRNTGDEELFVWLFDVGVSGRSSMLTNAGPSGTRLGPSGSGDHTLDVWGPAGEALFWPQDVPTADAEHGRPETFVLLTADRRSDLSALASSSASGAARARGVAASRLDALLDEARVGVREVAPTEPGEPPLRYRLDLVEFALVPR